MLFSGCKYPHQTVHQLKLTHLLMEVILNKWQKNPSSSREGL
ncbi:hypothetical protein BACIT_2998 [Bacillus amyloliquefaciens]|nr:hypothetical protein BACIT_2998 [Bacillus amyloliquefaciens]